MIALYKAVAYARPQMSEGTRPGDEELVLLARDGNLGAFNSLVERYQGAVYSLCLRLLRDREAAEDATQETFLSAYRAIRRFEGGNLRSWLLRIAANASKDELRRRKRKDPGTSFEAYGEQSGTPFEVADEGPLPAEVLERHENSAELEQLLAGLPPDQRDAIVLIDIYDFAYQEAADTLGASVGTLKSRVHRGRERLRQLLLSRPELIEGRRRLER